MKSILITLAALFSANAFANPEIQKKFLDESKIPLGVYQLISGNDSCQYGELKLIDVPPKNDEMTLKLGSDPLVFGIGKAQVDAGSNDIKSIITPYVAAGRTGYREVQTYRGSTTIYEVNVSFANGTLSYTRQVSKKAKADGAEKVIFKEACNLKLMQ